MRRSMRRGIAYILSAALVVSGITISNYEEKAVEGATTRKLVWSDEFDGTSLDTNVWNVEVNGDGGGNNELQYYVNDSDNINVSDGTLKITAKKEAYGGKAYTSGRINTKGKKTFKYGRIEAKMKLPSFTGSWPAFWMLGANYDSVGWPNCGEIDIMEAINAESAVHGTLHWGVNNNEASRGGSLTGVDRTEWHTYAIEWSETSITWYVDNNAYNTLAISSAEQMTEFQAEQFLIFNLAIGGNWPGFTVDDSAFPNNSTMEVDYVRVYQDVEAGDMSYETATRNDAFNSYGNWLVYVASSWANSSANVAVDPADADHIMIEQLTSDWSQAWSLQTRYVATGLTPGKTYSLSVDMITASTDGSYMTDAIEGATVALESGTKTLTRTGVADNNGELYITFGLGWVGIGVDVEFTNVVVTEGEVETTTQTTWTYEDAIKDNNFNPYGNWTVYVASTWGASTAQVGVNPTDADNIRIKPTASDWSSAWTVQAQYKATGLTAGESYVIMVDMKASTADGSYMTNAVESEEATPLTAETETIRGTFTADDNGEINITFGLGYVGISNIINFDNVQIYLESEAPTEEVVEEFVALDTFETAIKDEVFNPYGNWTVYVASTWGNASAEVAVDATDADHIQIKPLTSDWSAAWTLQAQYVKTGLTPGEKYAISADIKSLTMDGAYLTDAIEGQNQALDTATVTHTRYITADADGKVSITFGLGWVGLNNIVDLKNVTCVLASETETTTKAPEAGYESATKDDSFWHYGNWKVYVASSWGGSTAEVMVDEADANHIKVKQTASDWSQAWTVQAQYTVTGLEVGAVYELSADIFADTTDGGYLTDAIETEESIALTTEPTTVTGTYVANENGEISITFGLGWVGLNNPVDLSNIVYTKIADPEPVQPSVSLNGFQISTKYGGCRTLYTVDEGNVSEVVEAGLIYGLADYTTQDNMYVGAEDEYVASFAATEEGIHYTVGTQTMYVMTMAMNIGQITPEGLNANYYVRGYAKLSDGTYVYSDISDFSLYSIADVLYRDSSMSTVEGHNYLYNNILFPANNSYLPVFYNPANSLV